MATCCPRRTVVDRAYDTAPPPGHHHGPVRPPIRASTGQPTLLDAMTHWILPVEPQRGRPGLNRTNALDVDGRPAAPDAFGDGANVDRDVRGAEHGAFVGPDPG